MRPYTLTQTAQITPNPTCKRGGPYVRSGGGTACFDLVADFIASAEPLRALGKVSSRPNEPCFMRCRPIGQLVSFGRAPRFGLVANGQIRLFASRPTAGLSRGDLGVSAAILGAGLAAEH